MAVELTATDYSGTGTGAAATYGTGIYANASNQIKVYVDGVLQILGDDYSLNGVGTSAGVNVVGSFPSGAAVYIERDTAITQLVDTQNNETILEDVLDAEFDKLTMIAQELAGKAARAVLVPKGEAGFTLPPAAQRVGYAGWIAGKLAGVALPNTLIGGNITINVNTRAALAALPLPIVGAIAGLTEFGKEGMWICRAGSIPAADPLQGIYVASVAPGYYWARVWDRVTILLSWFDDGSGNLAAIVNAAKLFANDLVLERGTFWTTETIKLDRSGLRLRGQGQHYVSADSDCTRILTASATLNPIIQVGADSFPAGGVNNYMRGPKLEDVYVGRTIGPNKTAQPSGVLVQYCLGAEISRVKSVDSTNSFRFNGAVAYYIWRCNANRVVAGTGSGTDLWAGYWIDGSANIGLAGGNASSYIMECQAGCNISSLQTGQSYGYRMTGKFQDTFMFRPESVSCNIGISLEGGAGSGDADIKINEPIMDAPFKWGIYAADLSTDSTVNVTDPYCGLNGSTQFGIYVQNSFGMFNVLGGELLCGSQPGQGVAIIGCKRVAALGLQIWDCASVGVGINGTCANLRIETVHHNNAPVIAGTSPAVRIAGTGTTASIFSPMVSGKASGFSRGIEVQGAIDDRNAYHLAGIDSTAITGGANNKLVRNGTQVTAAGLSGSNTVTGPMT